MDIKPHGKERKGLNKGVILWLNCHGTKGDIMACPSTSEATTVENQMSRRRLQDHGGADKYDAQSLKKRVTHCLFRIAQPYEQVPSLEQLCYLYNNTATRNGLRRLFVD